MTESALAKYRELREALAQKPKKGVFASLFSGLFGRS
jgi:hypothetical protein